MLKKVSKVVVAPEVHNILSPTTNVIGNILTSDDMRCDGNIQGDINCEKKIVIGDKAVIKGNIRCASLDSLGYITGDVYCDDKMILRANSLLKGNVSVKSIEIEPGAVFEGTCTMHE